MYSIPNAHWLLPPSVYRNCSFKSQKLLFKKSAVAKWVFSVHTLFGFSVELDSPGLCCSPQSITFKTWILWSYGVILFSSGLSVLFVSVLQASVFCCQPVFLIHLHTLLGWSHQASWFKYRPYACSWQIFLLSRFYTQHLQLCVLYALQTQHSLNRTNQNWGAVFETSFSLTSHIQSIPKCSKIMSPPVCLYYLCSHLLKLLLAS